MIFTVGIFAFTSFRSRDLMSCDSTSPEWVAEEVYRHLGVDTLPNQSTTYQRNKHITNTCRATRYGWTDSDYKKF